MSTTRHRFGWLVGAVTVLALLTAACGGDDDGDTNANGSGANGDLSGEINISGSSTVQPVTSQAADDFASEAPDVDITVDGPGTGDGFKLFCEGEIDISDASRPIKPEEAEVCEAAGIEFVEIEVGFDGLTVMTNPGNDAVECLSFADLYAIVGPESQGVDTWSGAQELATELGSSTELPDLDLAITAPGEESGTYDSFIELALGDIEEARFEEGKADLDVDEAGDPQLVTRPDYSSQSDDNAIIQAMEGDEGAFGWVGFSFADLAGDAVKPLGIAAEADGACVTPTAETIADGSYPLARSLYIYVDIAKADENAAIPAFVDYFLANLTSIVEAADYVALPDDRAATSVARWEARTPGAAAA